MFNQYQTMRMMSLAQGHNTAPRLRIEPATLRSRVRRSFNRANGASPRNSSEIFQSGIHVRGAFGNCVAWYRLTNSFMFGIILNIYLPSFMFGIILSIYLPSLLGNKFHEYGTMQPRNMSLVVRKPVFGVSDQVPHKPGFTVTVYS